jgi:hypothetical protein
MSRATELSAICSCLVMLPWPHSGAMMGNAKLREGSHDFHADVSEK